MAKLTDSEVNENAIRRVDPLVKDLVDSATHVALYSFEAPKNEWELTNIQGAFFVYSRVEEPHYSMFIMNRSSPENLIEPIVKELDLQSQYPFLLYKTKKGLIYGIWFYNQEDCRRISDLLERLVKELGQQSRGNSKSNPKDKKPPVEKLGNGLIMNMLSKAQEEYNSNKSPMRNEKPRELESAPQSVMDFFAKAGAAENHLPQPPGFVNPVVPILRPGPAAFIVPSSVPAPVNEANHPILQRIMSNPVHTVEHIEKQQRSTTPGSRAKDMMVPGELDNSVLFMRLSESPSPGVIPTQQFFNSNISQPIEMLPNGIEAMEPKSALMPPTMFISSSSKDPGDKLMNGEQPASSVKHIEPLTKNQILQAVSYLLKNDSDFLNKLHEAYLNSFKDMVST